jgi:hypothetical protein
LRLNAVQSVAGSTHQSSSLYFWQRLNRNRQKCEGLRDEFGGATKEPYSAELRIPICSGAEFLGRIPVSLSSTSDVLQLVVQSFELETDQVVLVKQLLALSDQRLHFFHDLSGLAGFVRQVEFRHKTYTQSNVSTAR